MDYQKLFQEFDKQLEKPIIISEEHQEILDSWDIGEAMSLMDQNNFPYFVVGDDDIEDNESIMFAFSSFAYEEAKKCL